MLVQQGLHKTLQPKSAKPVGTLNKDWKEMDLKATSMIHQCLLDEVMYNVMDEEMAIGLWSRLETLIQVVRFMYVPKRSCLTL